MLCLSINGQRRRKQEINKYANRCVYIYMYVNRNCPPSYDTPMSASIAFSTIRPGDTATAYKRDGLSFTLLALVARNKGQMATAAISCMVAIMSGHDPKH